MSSRGRLQSRALDLCWSLWTELGVPGVVRNHQGHAVDVEPVLLLTAQLADDDPRLRDESIAWTARNQKFVSRARLRGLLRLDPVAQAAFGPYAASLSEVTPGSWPGATTPRWPPPRMRTKRQTSFEQPSLLRLRLRALLGAGARAEIAHAFVAFPTAEFAAQELARVSGFTRANVNQELDAFTAAGLLVRVGAANRWVYRLGEPERLLQFAGARPDIFVDWVVVLRLLGAIMALEKEPEHLVHPVEVAAFMDAHADDLKRAGFPSRAPNVVGEALAEWFDEAAVRFAETLARPHAPWRA